MAASLWARPSRTSRPGQRPRMPPFILGRVSLCAAIPADMRRQWPRVRRPHASLRQRRRRQPALRRAPCQMDSAAAVFVACVVAARWWWRAMRPSRAPNPTPMPSMSADGPSVLEWLNASRPGVCVTPTFSFAKRMLTDEDRCMIGTTGTFRLTRFSKEHKVNTLFVPSEASGVGESRTWEQAVASCLELCATCARCRHISVSPTLAYCAWHHRCDATGERDEAAACGVLSGAVYTNERE